MADGKPKIGRPSKYDPAFCERVLEMGREGASKAEMALELGIVYSTFDVWQNDIPEFSEAVKAAERLSQGWWEREGRKATFGACDGFNATSYIFQMKNRFRDDWREVVRKEVTGKDGGAIEYTERSQKISDIAAGLRTSKREDRGETLQ